MNEIPRFARNDIRLFISVQAGFHQSGKMSNVDLKVDFKF